ncbi:MAG TPA: hypothetical protein VMX55_13665 [candidate division Zixibacteria bacterium]|nr:hypothetical protein [candidate division Zixibacteria bacterium]
MSGYNYRWEKEFQREKAEENLKKFIKKYVAKYSPFYKKWFDENSIIPANIKNISDIQKIPSITKEHHIKDPSSFIMLPYMPEWWECINETEHLSQFDIFKYWLKSLNKLYLREVFGKEPLTYKERIIIEAVNDWLPAHFHNTGSSSEPLLITYTKRDLSKNIPEIAAQIYTTGFKSNWEVFNLIPASPTINFFQSVWTPLTVGGGTFFSCGEEMTTIDSQISLANKITFEVFLGTPSYITYWLTKAKEKLEQKKISEIKSIKLCILAGEFLSKEHKIQIKSLFESIGSSPQIIESYSNNRAKVSFIECSENSGIHLNPRYFNWEILNPKTLEPCEDEGYLCFSHIDWRGTVFLRFNTGDLIQGLEWKTCEHCGLTLPTIKGPIVRSQDDYFTLKKRKISKFTLENSIKSILGIRLFQLIISTNKIVVYADLDEKKKEKIIQELSEKIENITGIIPTIIVESLDTIREKLFSRGILKAEYIIIK